MPTVETPVTEQETTASVEELAAPEEETAVPAKESAATKEKTAAPAQALAATSPMQPTLHREKILHEDMVSPLGTVLAEQSELRQGPPSKACILDPDVDLWRAPLEEPAFAPGAPVTPVTPPSSASGLRGLSRRMIRLPLLHEFVGMNDVLSFTERGAIVAKESVLAHNERERKSNADDIMDGAQLLALVVAPSPCRKTEDQEISESGVSGIVDEGSVHVVPGGSVNVGTVDLGFPGGFGVGGLAESVVSGDTVVEGLVHMDPIVLESVGFAVSLFCGGFDDSGVSGSKVSGGAVDEGLVHGPSGAPRIRILPALWSLVALSLVALPQLQRQLLHQ